MNKILVTGANGFVGSVLCQQLVNKHYKVHGTVRDMSPSGFPPEVELVTIRVINEETDWDKALEGVSVVVHLAARVHIMNDKSEDPYMEFSKVNVDGTVNLARQSAACGVKRFIFLSSIKVNGELTRDGKVFGPDDTNIPADPYGLSKYEAEKALLDIAKETGMEVVIIRPPLVYGPGVKANFRSMMKWIQKGIPLPLGAVDNKRSLVALENLVSFIILCMKHPQAANEVFLISDGEDVSTTELLQKISHAFGKSPYLIPVPVGMLKLLANLIGKGDVANRLLGSLQLDSSKARNLLGWKSVVTMDEELKLTVDAYLKSLN